jgi:hypothetical protein
MMHAASTNKYLSWMVRNTHMPATTIIRIQEQQATTSDQPNALFSFNHSTQYPIHISDPFADDDRQEKDLEWYFEDYLNFPFTQTVRAQKAAASITHYGATLFAQIFVDQHARDQYKQATRQGLPTIQIEIAGSPTFHRLHWEALYDPDLKTSLSLHIPIIRQNITPQTYPATMRPSPTINVLVVVARPGGPRDMAYRTISRPLLDELQKIKQPVAVTLLRPGTYLALQEHLEKITRERGVGYYHIIHFDTHGGLLTYETFQRQIKPNPIFYQGRPGLSDLQPYEGKKAFLLLDSEHEGQSVPVEASEMAALLRLYQIPIAILNACQSGKYIGDEHEASLGSHLIAAGVQTVLAMGYSVSVSPLNA